MSTLKVDNIRHNNATSDAITMASDGTCTAKLTSVGGGQLSNRNLVINGAMNVAQRGVSFTTNGAYGADRFKTAFGAGGFNTQQVADAPVGFKNSIKVTQTSYGSASYKMLEHYIEGYNIISLGYGTAGAKTATLSFFVKGSVTGTYGVTIQNAATGGGRVSYVSSYTINSANTWEFKTVTVTPPTTYTWYTDTQRGLGIIFSLGSTGYSTSTLNQWQVANNSGATLQITGVQYEVGDTATSFEHLSRNEELERCKRYYQTLPSGLISVRMAQDTTYSNAGMQSTFILPTPMRANPGLSNWNDGSGTITHTFYNGNYSNATNYELNMFSAIHNGTVQFRFNYSQANNSSTSLATQFKFGISQEPIAFSAEL